MSELTHFNQAGEAHMVDIADKDQTHRIGIAEGWISMHPETFALVEKGNAKKGDVLAVARIAQRTDYLAELISEDTAASLTQC